ncbi:MAG: hypothetical protein WC703_03680 [Candidatus Neomarinimicrobiota bacterium]
MIAATIHIEAFSTILKITETTDRSEKILQFRKEIVRIAAAEFSSRDEQSEIQDRAESVLDDFIKQTKIYRPDSITVTAAECLAESQTLRNLRLFLKDRGFPSPQMLTPEMESRMFLPAGCLTNEEDFCVIRLGEGDFHIDAGTRRSVQMILTLRLGLCRLSDQFLGNSPPAPEDLIGLRQHISDELERFRWISRPGKCLCVSDAAVALWKFACPEAEKSTVRNIILTHADVQKIIKDIWTITPTELRRRGSDPNYQSLFLPTAILIEHLFRHFDLERIQILPLSVYSVS